MNISKEIVSKIIETKSLVEVLDYNIDETYFKGKWREVFKYIREFTISYETVPTLSELYDEFPKILLNDVDKNFSYLIDKLIKEKEKTVIEEGLVSIQREVKDNPSLAKHQLQLLLTEVMTNIGKKEDINLIEDTESRFKRHTERKKVKGIDGIPTGFDFIDEGTAGFHAEDLIVLVARQGVGKTFLSLILAVNQWKLGNKILYLTKEMSIDRIADRFDAIAGKLGYTAFRKGMVDKEYYKKKLDEIKLGTDFIVSQLHGGISVIMSKIQKHQPDVVYIDGMYLLEDERGAVAKWERMTNITRDLKVLAQLRKIPIVGTTQLNRGADGEDIELLNISYSDAIGQDADIVIAMYRTSEMKEVKEMGVRFLKLREGELNKGKMNWDFETMDFEFLEDDSLEDKEAFEF